MEVDNHYRWKEQAEERPRGEDEHLTRKRGEELKKGESERESVGSQ